MGLKKKLVPFYAQKKGTCSSKREQVKNTGYKRDGSKIIQAKQYKHNTSWHKKGPGWGAWSLESKVNKWFRMSGSETLLYHHTLIMDIFPV